MPVNIGDHRPMAQDNLLDGPAQNIAYYLGQVGVAGSFATGVKSSIVAATGAIAATETLVVNVPLVIPATYAGNTLAGTLNVGSVIRATIMGTCTSSNADSAVFTVRAGILGTKADASVCTGTVTTAGSGTAIPFKAVIDLTVRTLGASGTGYGYLSVQNTGVTGIVAVTNTVVALSSITALPTTTATFLDITLTTAATSATTIQTATIEVIP